MHPLLIAKLLCLLAAANGTPVVAKKLAGDAFARPIDGGLRWPDGQPLLGSSKTLRGLLLAVGATIVCSALLGLGWWVGALVGSAAMAGDALSSFVKRRIGLPPSSRATGLDQIPVSVLPLLASRHLLSLTLPDTAMIVFAFVIGEMLLSRVLFAWHLRDRPY